MVSSIRHAVSAFDAGPGKSCCMGFRNQTLMVVPAPLTKRLDAGPLTREPLIERQRNQAATKRARGRRAT